MTIGQNGDVTIENDRRSASCGPTAYNLDNRCSLLDVFRDIVNRDTPIREASY
jgi:hypothetical protein